MKTRLFNNRAIGWQAEDFDFLADRICMTSEFPEGRYGFFIPIDANGTPAFPFSIGRYWYGNNINGRVVSGNITQTAVTNFVGGPNAELRFAHRTCHV